MMRMGIEAIYRRPNTSKPAPGHKIYQYLLRGLVYLTAVVDLASRRVLSHSVSITMEAAFCVEM